MQIKAYAKINVSLKIYGKRDDGYHDIQSHMQALPDLYDVIDIEDLSDNRPRFMLTDEEAAPKKSIITCSDPTLSCGEDNLVAKALKLLGKTAKVHIQKNIPIAAGLGGGSADAAAVIYYYLGADDCSLQLAEEVGSDVPFCLLAIDHDGQCSAMAFGRGGQLIENFPMPGKIVVETPANCPVSTPAVYAEWDRQPSSTDHGNDLQEPAIRLCPQIQETLDELKKPHPIYGEPAIVRQSGSGPSCFAVYLNYK